jgi:hypothetical protein
MRKLCISVTHTNIELHHKPLNVGVKPCCFGNGHCLETDVDLLLSPALCSRGTNWALNNSWITSEHSHHRESRDLCSLKKTLKILVSQEAMNSQGNTQSKEQCRRYHDTQLQTILQSNNNKNSMVLAQKQT